MPEELSQHAKLILSAVIAHYIATAEPVGSPPSPSSGASGSPWPPSGNVIANLEEMGYLNQLHVSSGRVPMLKGMKFYVNSIVTMGELDEAAKARQEIRKVFQAAGQALSGISRQTTVVAVAIPETDIFEHMEFVLFRPGLVFGGLCLPRRRGAEPGGGGRKRPHSGQSG